MARINPFVIRPASKLEFFTFSQNNSGGSFIIDEKAGITEFVIVEAKDYNDANRRAKDIGLYFDGVANDQDCQCCGDRWCEQWNEHGTKKPEVYGKPVKDADCYGSNKIAAVHYVNGKIKIVKLRNR